MIGPGLHFVDDGYEDGLPVVFTGGLGTSVRVIRLLDFLETMRRDLKLITVEPATDLVAPSAMHGSLLWSATDLARLNSMIR